MGQRRSPALTMASRLQSLLNSAPKVIVTIVWIFRDYRYVITYMLGLINYIFYSDLSFWIFDIDNLYSARGFISTRHTFDHSKSDIEEQDCICTCMIWVKGPHSAVFGAICRLRFLQPTPLPLVSSVGMTWFFISYIFLKIYQRGFKKTDFFFPYHLLKTINRIDII